MTLLLSFIMHFHQDMLVSWGSHVEVHMDAQLYRSCLLYNENVHIISSHSLWGEFMNNGIFSYLPRYFPQQVMSVDFLDAKPSWFLTAT